MSHILVEIIAPQTILNAFGSYQIGFTQALKGNGGPDDGRFIDYITGWHSEPATVLKERYLKSLTREAKIGAYNFIEFWGWPEIRYRDDGTGMVYSRLRMMRVTVVMQPRSN